MTRLISLTLVFMLSGCMTTFDAWYCIKAVPDISCRNGLDEAGNCFGENTSYLCNCYVGEYSPDCRLGYNCEHHDALLGGSYWTCDKPGWDQWEHD